MSGIKLILYPLAFTGILTIVFTLIVPTYKEAQKIKTVDIVKAQKKLDEVIEISQNINSLKESYEMYQDDLRTLRYVLPEDEDLKSFLIQVEAIMLNNQIFYESVDPVQTNNIQISSASSNDELSAQISLPQKNSIKLVLVGPYENLVKALEQIENLNRASNVTSINFKVNPNILNAEENTTSSLNAEIELETYYQEDVTPQAVANIFKAEESSQSAEASSINSSN